MQVCTGVGMGLTPLCLVALLQTLACNVGGHTPESLAVRSIALHVLCFTSLEKCFHCVRIKIMPKSLRINWILISKFGPTDIFYYSLNREIFGKIKRLRNIKELELSRFELFRLNCIE